VACDLCLATLDDLHSVFRESQLLARNRQTYDEVITELDRMNNSCHVRGSGLLGLAYYHPDENDTCDILHDILEGVAPFEMQMMSN
jgi:hypothetical protein